jgi:hypothetical protein
MSRVLKSKAIALIAVFAVAMLSAACASAPTQEMSDARQSLQAARDAGAEKYAPENLRIADNYLKQAERELELRYFARARHDAILARSEAQKARTVAVTIHEAVTALEALDDEGRNLPQARSVLQEALEAAEHGKDKSAIRLALEAKRLAEGGGAGE